MAIKAFFLDFYGTCVHEDDEAVNYISAEIHKTCPDNVDISDINQFWWNEFSTHFSNAHGDNFDTKRNLMLLSIKNTIEHFKSTANPQSLSKHMFKLWQRPEIFPETKQFFERTQVPICIISNADRKDIECALNYHNLSPYMIITSEDVRSYKPSGQIFKSALKQMNLTSEEVIHIGDTISSDVVGAFKIGIDVVWLNRKDKPISDHLDETMVCKNLLEIFDLKYPFNYEI